MLAHAFGSKEQQPQAMKPGVQQAISHYVSRLCGVPLEDMDPLKSITALGADSLVVVEFRNWLRKVLGSTFAMGKDIGRLSIHELSQLAVGGAA